MKSGEREAAGCAGELDDGSPDCVARTESGGGADDPGASERRGLHHGTVAQDRYQRDHSAVWKIDLLEGFSGIMQNGAPLERYHSQMRRQQRIAARRQG